MRARKKSNLEPRLAACEALFFHDLEAVKGKIPAQFANPDAPLHLEIGCGKGKFICTLARMHPEVNFVAVEREPNVALATAERAMQGGFSPEELTQMREQNGDAPDALTRPLTNLRLILGDMDKLDGVFLDGTLTQVYINFCDPWHKRRQYKNRLTCRHRLERFLQLLAPGGELHFKTDNQMLYRFSLGEFAAAMPAYFTTEHLHASEYAAQNVMTEYETYFSGLGQPIYSIRAKK